MGKSWITLKLLDILWDEKIHKISEIQQVCNLSNSSVRIYVYELMSAGHYIESYRGKNGGYKLTKSRKKWYNIHM